MKFLKVRDVKSPNRGTPLSAGIDFYVPEDFESQWIEPHSSILIPAGIHVKVPSGYTLIAFNKSGVATKKQIVVGACVIDEDYQGEIHLHLINTSYTGTWVEAGQKIAQFILLPVLYAAPEECKSIDELYAAPTQRGRGGFGSTDKPTELVCMCKPPVVSKRAKNKQVCMNCKRPLS